MGDSWYTRSGKTGTVRLTEREEGWFVTEPATNTQTKCVLQGDFEIPGNHSTVTLDITVSKFMRAGSHGPNYLFAVPEGEKAGYEAKGTNSGSSSSTTKNTNTGAEKRSLAELSGSGDYITVEAIVDDVFWVKKDEANVPDIIGVLRDEDSGEKRMFVVSDGVKHPYLEEERKFAFQNAKDHYYERENKIQLMITQYTKFTDKGLTKGRSKTKPKRSPKAKSQSSRKKSSSGKSLKQIARTMLGGKELKMKQQDKDSTVGKAKKQARRQQRDPAIDPRLNE